MDMTAIANICFNVRYNCPIKSRPETPVRLRNTHDTGLLLKARRKTLGWSQAQLAQQLGITRQLVIALEKGTPGVAVGTVLKAFTALGLMLDANPRKASADSGPAQTPRSNPVRPELNYADIDNVIKNAISGTSLNSSISRPPLPLSLSRKKQHGNS